MGWLSTLYCVETLLKSEIARPCSDRPMAPNGGRADEFGQICRTPGGGLVVFSQVTVVLSKPSRFGNVEGIRHVAGLTWAVSTTLGTDKLPQALREDGHKTVVKH